MAKYHLSEDGTPRLCKAVAGNCPLAADGAHYASRKDAAEAYEKTMAASVIVTVSSSTRKLAKELNRLFGDKKASDIPLETLREAGAILERELLGRLGLDDFPEEPTKAERDGYSREIALMLKELDNRGVQFTAKIHGPLAKGLKEGISVLPPSAAARVKNDIYTKRLNLNNRQQDGFHVAQAEIYTPPEPVSHGAFMLGAQREGDYMLPNDASIEVRELNDESYLGFAIDKLVRTPKALAAGDSLLDYTKLVYRSEKLIIDLINDGVLDGRARLVAGKEDEFRERAPEWSEAIAGSFRTVSYYAGKPSTGKTAGGGKYFKVADSFEVTDANGDTHEVKRPLYEFQEKSLSYKAHTISAKGLSSRYVTHQFFFTSSLTRCKVNREAFPVRRNTSMKFREPILKSQTLTSTITTRGYRTITWVTLVEESSLLALPKLFSTPVTQITISS